MRFIIAARPILRNKFLLIVDRIQRKTDLAIETLNRRICLTL